MLVDGQWQRDAEPATLTGANGEFQRVVSGFRDRVTADGSSGFKAEAGRYHLYAAYNCPWAHRALIYRAVKGLEDAITVAYGLPADRDNGWTFDTRPGFEDCTPDTVNGFKYLHEAYTATEPNFTGKVTVPTLWDNKTKRIVNNESSDIIRMMDLGFGDIARVQTTFYPDALRAEIDRMNDFVYANINNGVYRAGFAQSQAAYEKAFDALFAALDELEARLGKQRYLIGNQITEADWRLLPTLLRFDVAYNSLFKCNKKRLVDYPNLQNYMLDLYGQPGIAQTVKPHYYMLGYWSQKRINPTGIIPKGLPLDLAAPHDRALCGLA
jgi:putative glutathione S-transferase